MNSFNERVSKAVAHFWQTRLRQSEKQGVQTGRKDSGDRSAVTGGAQLDGFISLVKEMLIDSGCPDKKIFIEKKEIKLPGFFRPSKEWDLLVIIEGALLATIEFKSQVGSFGNNFNNRVEEALGSATDLWTAYREGAFENSPRPWLGYFMLLEEADGSTKQTKRIQMPHFQIFNEFQQASYAKRYELFCKKIVRERLYDAACFMMSEKNSGLMGEYREPSVEISFKNFIASLLGHVTGYLKLSSDNT